MHYLVLGTPVPGLDVSGHNDWLASQMAADPASAVNMLVTPDMSADYVADQVNKHNFLGLKPYRTFASDPAEACKVSIPMGREAKLSKALHMVFGMSWSLRSRNTFFPESATSRTKSGPSRK